MELFAVFGQPIRHSLSPLMHNQAFVAEEKSAFYLPVSCPPEQLLAKLAGFRELGGHGANLTRPLKEHIVPHLSSYSPWVEKTGAANTIAWRSGGWIGDNTDVQALVSMLSRASRAFQGNALVLGQGGAAHASVAGLEALGYRVTVMARRSPKRVWHTPWMDWEPESLHYPPYDIVVNATPLGQQGESPWPVVPLFHPETTVVDWVYRPNVTLLIQQAAQSGARSIDGLSLLVRQAALSWSLWFGHEGPEEVMRDAVKEYHDK